MVDKYDLDHPESPYRLRAMFEALKREGLLQKMHRLEPEPCSRKDIELVHSERLYRQLLSTREMVESELLNASSTWYNSVYVNEHSFDCARLAAGGVVQACKAVMTGQYGNAIAMVRPPSHHAEPDEAGGFCLFNSVAIAAKVLQRDKLCQRIMILDWDVHHGNGTQTAFYDDPNVLFVSLHRYEDAQFYPSNPKANYTHVGGPSAQGYNVNIPWPSGGFGNFDYMHMFHQVVMPVAHQFAPDLVIISAGFDAAWNDPLGGCRLTYEGYGQMTHQLMSVCPRTVLCLEGGYHLGDISRSLVACAQVMLGGAPDQLPDDPNASAMLMRKYGQHRHPRIAAYDSASSSSGGDTENDNDQQIIHRLVGTTDDDDDDLTDNAALENELAELHAEQKIEPVHVTAQQRKIMRSPVAECVMLCEQIKPYFAQWWSSLGAPLLDVPEDSASTSLLEVVKQWRAQRMNGYEVFELSGNFRDQVQLLEFSYMQYDADFTNLLYVHDMPSVIIKTNAVENGVDLQLSTFHDESDALRELLSSSGELRYDHAVQLGNKSAYRSLSNGRDQEFAATVSFPIEEFLGTKHAKVGAVVISGNIVRHISRLIQHLPRRKVVIVDLAGEWDVDQFHDLFGDISGLSEELYQSMVDRRKWYTDCVTVFQPAVDAPASRKRKVDSVGSDFESDDDYNTPVVSSKQVPGRIVHLARGIKVFDIPSGLSMAHFVEQYKQQMLDLVISKYNL